RPSSACSARRSTFTIAGQARVSKASSSTSSSTTGSATRWKLMSRSLFLSIISASLAGGCGGDDCGPMGAPEFGLAASSDQVTLTFGDLRSGPNHDCPDPMSTVEPLTIAGMQMGGTGVVTFCIPRPDLLANQDLALGTEVMIIDLNGMDTMCSY